MLTVSVLLAAAAVEVAAVVSVEEAAAVADDGVESVPELVTHEVTSCISTVPSAEVTGVSVMVHVSSTGPFALISQ